MLKVSLLIVTMGLIISLQAQVIPVFPAKPTDGDKKSDAKPKPKVVYKEKIVYRDRPVEKPAKKNNTINPEMVNIEGGTFTMGSIDSEAHYNEKVLHRVTVSSFSIGKYEVTQAQWQAVMGSNPSHFTDCPTCPVENVSWDDAQDYLAKLNQLTGKHYRLPTEAEWEFAARGGNKSRGYKYVGGNMPDDVGWYIGNSGQKTHPIGSLQPNELGLYDMVGNVCEWCSDWFGAYKGGDCTDPSGAESGTYRVLRGGSWKSPTRDCRATDRVDGTPDGRFSSLGLRVVCSHQ